MITFSGIWVVSFLNLGQDVFAYPTRRVCSFNLAVMETRGIFIPFLIVDGTRIVPRPITAQVRAVLERFSEV
jgi:hypothetical protein